MNTVGSTLPDRDMQKLEPVKRGVLILSHGRAGRLDTFEMLRDQGYTGEIRILVDDEDEQLPEYVKNFGDAVCVYSKNDVQSRYPHIFCDAFGDIRNVVIFARQAAWDVAASLGWDVFIELDDDYTGVYFKFDGNGKYLTSEKRVKCLDAVFDALYDFYCSTRTLVLAISQSGDWIGGRRAHRVRSPFWRKTMNFFVLSPHRRFDWLGRINEDVCLNVFYNSRGYLLLTVASLQVRQRATQQRSGGMTGEYRKYGTYLKSFFPVLLAPAAVTVAKIGTHERVHHNIRWRNVAVGVVDSECSRVLV